MPYQLTQAVDAGLRLRRRADVPWVALIGVMAACVGLAVACFLLLEGIQLGYFVLWLALTFGIVPFIVTSEASRRLPDEVIVDQSGTCVVLTRRRERGVGFIPFDQLERIDILPMADSSGRLPPPGRGARYGLELVMKNGLRLPLGPFDSEAQALSTLVLLEKRIDLTQPQRPLPRAELPPSLHLEEGAGGVRLTWKNPPRASLMLGAFLSMASFFMVLWLIVERAPELGRGRLIGFVALAGAGIGAALLLGFLRSTYRRWQLRVQEGQLEVGWLESAGQLHKPLRLRLEEIASAGVGWRSDVEGPSLFILTPPVETSPSATSWSKLKNLALEPHVHRIELGLLRIDELAAVCQALRPLIHRASTHGPTEGAVGTLWWQEPAPEPIGEPKPAVSDLAWGVGLLLTFPLQILELAAILLTVLVLKEDLHPLLWLEWFLIGARAILAAGAVPRLWQCQWRKTAVLLAAVLMTLIVEAGLGRSVFFGAVDWVLLATSCYAGLTLYRHGKS